MATTTETATIKGSERQRAEGSKHIETVPDNEEVTVTILIRAPPDSPPVPDLEYWQNTPIAEQKFLTSEDYAKIYGATQSDIDNVRAFVEGHGLTVLDSHAGRRKVIIKGTAKQMNLAFGVKLQRYESLLPQKRAQTSAADIETQTHRGYDGLVTVPKNLAGIVTAVVGLDDRRIAVSQAGTGDPPDSMALLAPTVASYYNFPNAGASDQVIGIPEFSPAGYLESDFTKFYFPSLPRGYDNLPQINSISAGSTNLGISSGDAIETLVDIAVSGTVAQGATINVYFAPNSEAGFIEFFTRVLIPETEAQPTVVSISYIWVNDGAIGSPTTPGSFVYTATNLIRDITSLGINVFAASGDWGANDSVFGGPHVGYPSTDPMVTSCGGTILGNATGSPPVFQEWVWSDERIGQFGGATGGGSSAIFPIPPYQSAAGITQIKDSSGKIYTNRFVPDIAGMNPMTGFYFGGRPAGPIWGTSLVAPLYAGLTAVVRSALGIRIGALNPILYPLGRLIFNDVTYGNNDSGAGNAYFIAGPGYDACTGWGSLDGTKFLNALAKLYFRQRLLFEIKHHVYTLEKVKHISSYPAAFKLVLEGFTPNAVGFQRPTLNGPFSALKDVSIIVGPPIPENPSKPFTPQRISYTCEITFHRDAIHTTANGGIFPDTEDPAFHKSLGAKIDILGDTLVADKREIELETDNKDRYTGKVTGLIYDRFGDFEGFILSTESQEKIFRKGEKSAEELIRLAWEKRILISVIVSHDHSAHSIILRSFSHS